MDLKVRLVVFFLSLVWLLVVLRMVKRRRIWERYAILWVTLGFGVLTMPLLVDILDTFLKRLGVEHPPSFYFLVAILGVLLIILQCTVEITTLVRKSRDAVQELAILEERVERLEESIEKTAEASAAKKGAE